jgi:ATP-dependent HslUV protease ATP-binding subunit HslU
VQISFSEDAIDEIAKYAMMVNEKLQNIGARRLHTVMERLLEDVLFDAPEIAVKTIHFTGDRVQQKLDPIVRQMTVEGYAV